MKIKKLVYLAAMTFGISAHFTSCNYLDADEYLNEVENLNDIWTERSSIRKTWAACYGAMPNFTDMASSWLFHANYDEMHFGRDQYACAKFAWGQYNADSPVMNLWTPIYAAVRTCNLFLENYTKANDKLLEEGEVEGYAMDVLFLRAFYYSLLMEAYGPFVIVDHTIDYSDESQYPTKRATLQECLDFILGDLEKCIEKLPDTDRIVADDMGRPSRQAAMALKAHVLLWAASPLVNGNTAYVDFVNAEGIPYFNVGAPDMEKWKAAADAAKAVIDENKFELFTMPANAGYVTVPLGDFEGNDVAWPNGPAGIDPYRSYKALFSGGKNYWNSEVIWQVNLPGQTNNLSVMAFPRSYYNTDQTRAHFMCATQKMVDAFFMNNGQTIEEANGTLYQDFGPAQDGDGYYINGEGNTMKTLSPVITGFKVSSDEEIISPCPNRCLNREARFYANIGFQGRGYIGGSNKIYYGDYRADMPDGYIVTDRSSARTCYTIWKWGNDDDDRVGTGSVAKQYPIFRLAEMYLAYAEALNEYDPGNPDILHYLNLIRYRAGLPGYKSGTQDEIRTYIKRERYVEFAFEGKRYFDSRRWKDAELTSRDAFGNSLGMGGQVFGCNYTVNTSDFYERYVIDGYLFKKQNYFLPIPYTEVANHWGEMVQNPGW